jgi:fructose-bisphosphate aldolase class I
MNMNTRNLIDTARMLVASDKGLLAMDESNPTCHKRFAKLGIPQTVEARRSYREWIVTAPGLGESISGAILYDETIRQHKTDGTPFVKGLAAAGIISGIKVDAGAKDMAGHPGEKITEGLDGLRDCLAEYAKIGLAVCQEACDDCHRRRNTQPKLPRSQRTRAKSRLPWALTFSFSRAL